MPSAEDKLPFFFVGALASGASTVFIGSFPFSVGLGLAASSFGGFGNFALRLTGIMSIIGKERPTLLAPVLSNEQRVGMFAYFYRAMAPFAVTAFGLGAGAYFAASRLISASLRTTVFTLPTGHKASSRALLWTASAFSLIGVPFTLAVMRSTVKTLLSIADGHSDTDLSSTQGQRRLDENLDRWILFNDIRLSFSIVAWALAVTAIVA